MPIKKFAVKSKKEYTDRNGDEKTLWLGIGTVIEFENGNMVLELNILPGIQYSIFPSFDRIYMPCWDSWNSSVQSNMLSFIIFRRPHVSESECGKHAPAKTSQPANACAIKKRICHQTIPWNPGKMNAFMMNIKNIHTLVGQYSKI